MNLSELESEIRTSSFRGLTVYEHTEGWMVSLRTEEGFRVFYGEDLDETARRALDGGPQNPPDDDWEELI